MEAKRTDAALTPDHYFAALKLIEQLYKDGELPAYIFRNILKDYSDVVDLSKFILIGNQAEEVVA